MHRRGPGRCYRALSHGHGRKQALHFALPRRRLPRRRLRRVRAAPHHRRRGLGRRRSPHKRHRRGDRCVAAPRVASVRRRRARLAQRRSFPTPPQKWFQTRDDIYGYSRKVREALGLQGKATVENGLLHIDLVREVPEAQKPRTIAIKAAPANALVTSRVPAEGFTEFRGF